MDAPFNLQDGEKIITTVKPIKNGYILNRSFGGIIFFFILALFFGIMGMNIILFIVIFVFGIVISLIFPIISYNKYQIWITNRRIVSERGLVGYNFDSIPLENINDVILNRSLTDRILNLSSLTIVPMGGIIYNSRSSNLSTVGYIPALLPEDANNLQKTIYELINKRKKELFSGRDI